MLVLRSLFRRPEPERLGRTSPHWRSLLPLLAAVVFALGTNACAGETEGLGDSESHFLLVCNDDADCGDLSCVCNVCSIECDASKQCASLTASAVCTVRDATACVVSSCQVECSKDADCEESSVCAAGTCQRPNEDALRSAPVDDPPVDDPPVDDPPVDDPPVDDRPAEESPCALTPCDFGTCVDEGAGDYRCDCDPGFEGPLCSTNSDDCLPDSCAHGECIDRVEGFSCDCDLNWAGDRCDACDEGFSLHKGACVDWGDEICAGVTDSQDGDWASQVGTTIVVHRSQDTSVCEFTETPLYFSTVSGIDDHWSLASTSAIYNPTPLGFSTYLRQLYDVTPADALANEWEVNWMAVRNGIVSDQLCTGTTGAGTTWTQLDTHTIYTEIDTSECGFAEVPQYFTSLGGAYEQWLMLGGNAIHVPTATGFRIELLRENMTVAEADTRELHVNWMGVSRELSSRSACNGQAPSGEDVWETYVPPLDAPIQGSNVQLHSDASSCGFSETPVYLASVPGTAHTFAAGHAALYWPSASGFYTRIFHANGSTPQSASDNGWAVDWLALPAH